MCIIYSGAFSKIIIPHSRRKPTSNFLTLQKFFKSASISWLQEISIFCLVIIFLYLLLKRFLVLPLNYFWITWGSVCVG